MAPASTNSSIGSGKMSKTVTSYPALIKFFAMGLPMIPRPMKPIFSAMLLLLSKSA